ncbi:MAG: CotH kinase family protein [Propionibacteriaceae bacterium]|jgi:spore coat protein CotH|nr:CotH kinase family protein [Propionibacteriaceae bacterium]
MSLRRLAPLPWRRHWKGVVIGLGAAGLVMGLFGSLPLKPYAVAPPAADDDVSQDVAGTVSLFDPTVEHRIELSFQESDLDMLLDDYFDGQSKTWIPGDLVVDGVVVSDVGLRLKGNSTLRMLRDDRSGATTGSTSTGTGGGFDPAGGALGEGTESALSASRPETLPWLISFDHYVKGRAYQGLTELAVRPAAGFANSFETLLNEALALAVTAQTSQPSQRSAYCLYTVNQRAAVTRLVVEVPEAGYAQSVLGGDGALYKVLSTGQFAYQGQDQTEYEDDFKQVSATGVWDIQPVIELLEWLEEASDERFAAELDDWVDVDGLATYLATQSILGNSDALDGPGRNGYLWYDAGDDRISVVAWDLNLAFSGGRGGLGAGGWPGTTRGQTPESPDPADPVQPTADASPASASTSPSPSASPIASAQPTSSAGPIAPAGTAPGGTVPTAVPRAGAQRPGGWGGTRPGGTTRFDPTQMDPTQFDPTQMDPTQMDPAQFDPGALGAGLPEAGAAAGRTPVGGLGAGGTMGVSNTLIDRFEANADFAAAVEAKRIALVEQIYASGLADRLLTELAAQIPVSSNISAELIASETATLRQTLAGLAT